MPPVQKSGQPAAARLALSLIAAALLGSGMLPCAGCATAAAGPAPDDGWIDDPGQVRGTLAAVGAQTFVSDEGLARVAAEADARARLSAVLRAEIEQVVTDWSRETGNHRIAGSLTSVIDGEVFTHQLVDAPVRGTVAQAFRRRGNTMYCLLLIPNDGSDAWYEAVGVALEDAAAGDETVWGAGDPAPVDLTAPDPKAEGPTAEEQLADAREQLAAILEKRRREQAEKLRQLRERAQSGR